KTARRSYSSSRSTRRSRPVWVWGSLSSGRSLRPMAASSGPRTTPSAGQPSTSSSHILTRNSMSECDAPIYIVDDDDSVRRGLARLLRSAGYRVETFASVREFLDRGDLDGAGCLVLDIRMPGETGLDLHQALIEQGRALPVIFITGNGNIPMTMLTMQRDAVD